MVVLLIWEEAMKGDCLDSLKCELMLPKLTTLDLQYYIDIYPLNAAMTCFHFLR